MTHAAHTPHAESPRHRIAPLPREVVERIAAGEVIERPASVARELIENALDAGARTLRVEMREGGLRLLRVADDGCGIPAEELEAACQPHTTSKIASLEDLDELATLGFRGEALASIIAAAEVEVASAADGANTAGLASTITLAGGQILARGAVPRPRGTTVSVRGLFEHLPARRNLLRGPQSEGTRVLAVVRAYALAHPAVRFTLVSDGSIALASPGTDLAGAVAAIYGSDAARALLPLDPVSLPGARLTGNVAGRPFSAATRDGIILCVNGRPVASSALARAAEAGYRPLLRKGRHPLLVVRIEAEAGEVDANVHPAKAQVLLRQEVALASGLRDSISRTLGAAPISLPATLPQITVAGSPLGRSLQLPLPTPRTRRGLRLARPQRLPLLPEPDGEVAGKSDEAGEHSAHPFPRLEALAQFDHALILARSAEGHLYLVDQHRAHERILYERLCALHAAPHLAHPETRETALPSPEPPTAHDEATPPPLGQLLLEPMVVELTRSQAAVLAPRVDELRRMGLECQPFGGSVFLLRAVPLLPGARQSPLALAQSLLEEAAVDADDWLDHVRIALACHSAVRRGQALTPVEQRALLANLRTVRAGAVCPHGSPLLLRYTAAALTRAFEW